MEHRKKVIEDLAELRDSLKCSLGVCEPVAMETLNSAIYELEYTGYPSDGVWYIEQRGSSARLILTPAEVAAADIPTLAAMEARREAAQDALRAGGLYSVFIYDIVTKVFKALVNNYENNRT